MVIDIKKPGLFNRPPDLFDFARAYLSEAFPNPDRAGCPPDHLLRRFTRSPRLEHPSIADHVSCCSPCFKAYTAYLGQARTEAKQSRQTTRATWIRWSLVSTSSAILLLTVVYILLRKPPESSATHKPPAISHPASSSQTPVAGSVRVLLDLTTAAPERGHQLRSQTPAQKIPAQSRIDLTLRLPIGSEASMYSVRLTSKRGTEWSGAARAHMEDGQPVLNMPGDFSHIPGGTYKLVVASKGQRLRLPVVIARTPDE